MSLKAVKLDPFLLAGLFTEPLIPAGNDRKEQPPFSPPVSVPSLGNNKQNILLLLHNEDTAYLDEHHFTLLSNILKACRYSLDDVALVNTAATNADWFHLKVQFNPHRALLFGNALAEIAPHKKPNDVWEEENCRFLKADTLEAIDKNVSLKALFWKALQQFFQL